MYEAIDKISQKFCSQFSSIVEIFLTQGIKTNKEIYLQFIAESISKNRICVKINQTWKLISACSHIGPWCTTIQ